MIEDPNDMKNRTHSEISDELQATDRALLLALSSRQRDKTPLSLDHERLIDNWIAGHLSPSDADKAAELTKCNKFAAERVFERRLITAAEHGPGISGALAARILKTAVSPRIDTVTHSALTGVSESPKTWTSRIVNWVGAERGEPIFGGWDLFRLGQVAAIGLMALAGPPEKIERGSTFNFVSGRLGGGGGAVGFGGGGGAVYGGGGGPATPLFTPLTLYTGLAVAFGFFAAWLLIRTLSTVTREHHPIRSWCYVLVDSAIFVCCSVLFLLAVQSR
jgi:hypothetical protein